MKNEPLIPLKHAELMFVAMSTLVHVIEEKTDYPTENMKVVLDGYESARDKFLKGKGLAINEIRLYTAAATEALIEWLDSQADKREKDSKHFELWATELEEE